MKRLCRWFPFTIVTAIGLLLSWLAGVLGILYDSGGAGSLLFYLGWAFQFLINFGHEIVHGFHLPTLALQRGAEIVLGFLFAVSLDLILRRICQQKT